MTKPNSAEPDDLLELRDQYRGSWEQVTRLAAEVHAGNLGDPRLSATGVQWGDPAIPTVQATAATKLSQAGLASVTDAPHASEDR